MTTYKRKRDLLTALNHIERFHRRRTVFIAHLVLSFAVQCAVWANWYASYAARGVGFEGNFFADRFIISVALFLFLVGHFFIVRTLEAKDLLVVKAIQQYDAEDEVIENWNNRLSDDDEVDEFEAAIVDKRKGLRG